MEPELVFKSFEEESLVEKEECVMKILAVFGARSGFYLSFSSF